MKRSKTLGRRRFLAAAGSAAAAAAAGCGGAGSPYRVLSTAEAATLAAAANRIIPRDDFPGAGDVGAARFVDRCLAGPYAHWLENYRDGLGEMDNAARAKYGRPFPELSAAVQDALLSEREPTPFFRLLRDHVMQSYYGDPRHGGNPDAVSWAMLGIPNPPVRGREQYDVRAATGGPVALRGRRCGPRRSVSL